ncbi:MAG: ABC transporter substrate-binding protein [Propionibacteriaceae bacterium]|jgi:iron(III) transport system substrate-binding protein|nr:ABC transporter substrate-binding protein [Propionibacteriaceae bacterium]
MKRIAICAAATALALTFSACSSSSDTIKDADGNEVAKELTIYTAMSEDELPTYFGGFEKATGIKVNYVRLSAGEMVTRIEGEKENPQATLAYAGASDAYIQMAAEGLLSKYASPELANIPDQYKDPDGYWNPIYVGAISFACNKDWFDKHTDVAIPQSWDDLTNPGLKGMVGMAHPSTAGTSYTVLATIMQLKGGKNIDDADTWAYLKKLNENVPQYSKAGSAPAQDAAMGEAAVGITFAHDALKIKAKGYPLEVTFPNDGTGDELGAVALLNNPNASEADIAAGKKFIDYMLSKEGQELYIDSASYRVPVNTQAKVADGLVTLDQLKIIDYDAKWAAQTKKELVAKFQEIVDNGQNVKTS